MRDGTVTWRFELPLSWGGRLVRTVAEHPDRATAVASVAAHRAVDDESARWAEPVPPHDQPS